MNNHATTHSTAQRATPWHSACAAVSLKMWSFINEILIAQIDPGDKWDSPNTTAVVVLWSATLHKASVKAKQ